MYCSYRTDAALDGNCNIVMKVACCSDLPRHSGGKSYDKASSQRSTKLAGGQDNADDDEGDDGDEPYYAVVKSKLLRIPIEQY